MQKIQSRAHRKKYNRFNKSALKNQCNLNVSDKRMEAGIIAPIQNAFNWHWKSQQIK